MKKGTVESKVSINHTVSNVPFDPKFVKIRDGYYQLSSIQTVRKYAGAKAGYDGVVRQYVITLTIDSVPNGDVKYRTVWANEDEMGGLLEYLDEITKGGKK